MRHSILQARPLNEWLILLDRTALPVHTGQKERVQRVMASPSSSLGEISRAISEAPSIALILFREANRSRNSLSEPAHNLDAVLKRLGMTRCTALLNSLMDESQVPIPANLRQVWLIGQHANHHANALFAHKMARLWQEIHWGSLLFLSPLWPLLTRYPDFLQVWEQRVLGNREPAYRVEQELLGVPLVRLCHALAERWALPQWIIDGYATLASNPRIIARALYLARMHQRPLEQQRRLDEQKDLNSWLRQPANSIVMANGLAVAVHNSGGDNHSLRWQRLISLYLHQPLEDVQQKLHQTSVEHARYLGPTNLWHPARALIWPWATRRILPAVPTQPDTQAAAPVNTRKHSAPQQPVFDFAQWKSEAQQLVRPSQFRNTLQLLNHYAGMLKHCALSRVLILSINNSTGQLAPVCQLGFRFTLQKSLADRSTSPVFRHIMRHNEPLHIHSQNFSQIADHLEHGFLETLASQNLLAGCIRHKEKPVLLVLADTWDQPITADSIKAFAASNRCLEQALALWKA